MINVYIYILITPSHCLTLINYFMNGYIDASVSDEFSLHDCYEVMIVYIYLI